MVRASIGAVVSVCFFLTACVEPALPPETIATVNGKPILLQHVEVYTDILGGSQVLGTEPSAEMLREKYGTALSQLIIGTLAQQTLADAQIPILHEDVLAAEQEIRADYGQKEFEKSLHEEYIDIEIWRELLAMRLAILRLQEYILRPAIHITADEVAAYYAAHSKDFYAPAKVEILVYAGHSKPFMEAQHDAASAQQKISASPDMVFQQLQVPLERLPEQWRKDLQHVGEGGVTPVREFDGLYQFLVWRSMRTAHTLDVVEAYPHIEKILVESKEPAVYDAWLERVVQQSTIAISPLLLHKQENDSTAKNTTSWLKNMLLRRTALKNTEQAQDLAKE